MNAEEALKFTDALVFSKLGMHLNDLQRLLVKSAWSDSRRCYEQIAKDNGYSPSYLKQDVGPKLWQLLSSVFGEKVKKNNFKGVLERQAGLVYRFASSGYGLAVTDITENTEVSIQQPAFANSPNLTILPPSINQQPVNNKSHDWNKAPDVSIFYGREQEQTTLKKWIKIDNCRMIAILGMGGIGKTYLSVKLAEAIQSEFDFLIWRSLENEPSLKDILNDLLQCIGQEGVANLCESTDTKISLVFDYLRQYRCLLILDNVETILNGGENVGDYKPGFEDYGDFFKGVGECRHQSCLIITSREKLKEIALMEWENSPVRSMRLRGLNVGDGKQLLQLKGCHSESENEYKYLVEQYSGNPLTLKIAAVAIKELFQGDIKEFIQHETLVIDGVFNLLEQQFNRLPNVAKSILRWLAIHREPVSIAQLLSEIYPPVQPQVLMENLKYLIQASLVENKGNQFTLKRILMDFITTLLIREIYQDILAGKLDLINSYSLVKAKNKNSTNKSGMNFIIKPVMNKLIAVFKKSSDLGMHLKDMYSKIDKSPGNKSGYAAKNIFAIICHIPNNLVGHSLYSKVSESRNKLIKLNDENKKYFSD
ncbi:MAG: NB-ARC domain-containing protein [Rivularia sp. (in: cyanobacteria)]|jgi:hypothetical protein